VPVEPVGELDAPYSEPGAQPVPWTAAAEALERAGVYWLSTVRPDGRPHVTPIAGVLMDDVLYFATGPDERKAMNLAHNAGCAVTTGSNAFGHGLDVVVEGTADLVTEKSVLERLAAAYAAKYDDFFGLRVGDRGFVHGEGSRADVYRVVPAKAFAYGRGPYTATRFRFPS
jgi:general stress protein 26